MEKEGRTLNSHNNIPKPTLGRLPAYLRYLKSLPPECKTISATAIARALGLGEVQVRKDLGSTSGEGRPRVGYITGELITSLETCLGQNAMCKAVIVGAGKLGSALLDYEGFSVYGIEIAAAFDSRAGEWEFSQKGKPIYPMGHFSNFCRLQDIKVGIIAVPKDAAQEVCNLMVKNNIPAIWSFAPAQLSVPEGVTLQQEDLALSLAHLCKQI